MKSLPSVQPQKYRRPPRSIRRAWLRVISTSLVVKAIVLSSPIAIGSAAAWLHWTPAAQAYTTEDLLTVSLVAGEDYTALARRAELAARSMAQQRFDSDILLTRVVITVLGDNGGQVAPILVMDVNRNDWRNRPDPRLWSQYYYSTPRLLQLDGGAPARTTQPTTPAPTAPVSTPSPAPGVTPAPAPTPQPSPSPTAERDRAPISPSNQTPSQNQPISQPNTQPTSQPTLQSPPAASTSPTAQPTLQPTPVPTAQPTDPTQLPSGSTTSPPAVNIPATPAGEVGLPRSILR